MKMILEKVQNENSGDNYVPLCRHETYLRKARCFVVGKTTGISICNIPSQSRIFSTRRY
jgi:hypothetical protein